MNKIARDQLFVGGLVIVCAAMLVACSSSSTGASSSAALSARVAVPGSGTEQPASKIPWDRVGPGWILATWSIAPDPPDQHPPTDRPLPEGPVTLYLLEPSGGRYAITTLAPVAGRDGASRAPRLVDWSGDGRHALFKDMYSVEGHTAVIDVDLATGAKQTFTVDHGYVEGNYGRPTGQGLFLSYSDASAGYPHKLERVVLSGATQLTFPTDQLGAAGKFSGDYLQTPDGSQLVLGADKGMVVVGNDGMVARQLPMPGPRSSCKPVRWWTSAVILAACDLPPSAPTNVANETQLWQVPLAGGTPTALTSADGRDLGYWNAWQVPGGTFLQNVPGCGGDGLLFRLTTDMQTTKVLVPGVDSTKSVFVIGVIAGKLVVKATRGCGSRTMSLLLYDPAANTASVLPSPPGNGDVKNAILYPTS